MSPTSTPVFGPDFVKDLILSMHEKISEATAQGYRMVWDAGVQVVLHNLGWVLLGLFVILALSAFEAFTTGRWGWFGSVLYHYLFGGVMIVIGFIFGPEIFANDYFKIVAVITYVVCFWLVGRILKKTGLRRF
jgi:hypothetical protein